MTRQTTEEHVDVQVCAPVEATMSVLGRRWAGAVVEAMIGGASRFSDIRRAVPGITDAVLATRLRELVDRGFAQRVVSQESPVTVCYTLTEAGRDLDPVLREIAAFGRRHASLLGGAL